MEPEDDINQEEMPVGEEHYGQIEEEEIEVEQEQEQHDNELADEGVYEGEDDVGLYGEEIDEEEMESYENEGNSEEEREFEEEEKMIKKGGR